MVYHNDFVGYWNEKNANYAKSFLPPMKEQKTVKQIYRDRPNCVNFDSARQSQIEAQRSERGRPFPVGKADEEDRFGKVAASQNSHNWGGRGITST